MDGQFDSNYYIAIVTIVPLLYITLFLQSEFMHGFSETVGMAYGKQLAIILNILDDWSHRKFRLGQVWALIKVFFFVVYFIGPSLYVVIASVLAGPVAAGYSIWALFHQSDVSYMRIVTLLATLGLLILATFGPAATLFRNSFGPQIKVAEKYVRVRIGAIEHGTPDQQEKPEGG